MLHTTFLCVFDSTNASSGFVLVQKSQKPQPNSSLLPKAVQVCILCSIFYLVLCIRVIFLTSNGEDINDPGSGQIGKWAVW